jgi:hypothetical protein
MPPRAQIVAQLLSDLGPSNSERRTGDDERPFARAAGLECGAGGGGHHRAKDVVSIILYQAMNHLGLWRMKSANDQCQ